MSRKTLKFDNTLVNKKSHASKQAIDLNLSDLNKIIISDKFQHSDKGFTYFIGYKNENIFEDDSVLVKYNEIWNKIKKTFNMKFHCMPVYDEKYIKATVKECNGVVKSNVWGDKVSKEGVHHTCIACRSIDSVMEMEKRRIIHKFIQKNARIR